MDEERLAPLATELAARGELLEAAAELRLVERLREGQGERIDLRLAWWSDLDLHAHRAAMLSRVARSPDP